MLQLDPNKKKQLDSNIKSMLDNGASQEDVMKYATDFKEKFSEKKKDGTNSNSTSTSDSQKLVSAPKNGSSGTTKQPEYEYKPIKDERGREVYEKDAFGNLVPKKEKVLKGYASSTEEREIVREEVKQKALKPIKTSVNLQKYEEATKPTEQEVNEKITEIEDEINQKGFGNGFSTGLKKGANFLSDVFTTIGTFGTQTTGPNFDLNPYSKEQEQAKRELTAEFKGDTSKFSDEDILSKTKQIVLNKKIEGLKIDKNNSFLSNLSENDKRALELEKIANYKTITAKDKYLATEASILINETEKNAKDYNVVKAIVLKNNKEGKQTPKELLDYGIEIEGKLRNAVTQATELENKIAENRNEIGSTEEEIDFLKRNYSMKDKFITNVKLGFGDIYMNLGVKQELAIGDAFGVIDEERKQEIIDQSIDWENAKQIYKNKESRDISFENLGVNNFGEFFFQELGTQVPIFAQIAMPGGVTSIGLTSAFDKYSQMVVEDKKDDKINYDKLQMISTAIGFGASEAVLGALPTKGILSRSVRSFEQAGQRQLLRESGKQYLQRKGIGIIESGSMEAVTEGLTQVTQNLLDKSILGKKEIGLFDNVDHAAFSGGMLGGAMTMMPTVAGLIIKPFSENKQSKEINENLQMIFNLQEQLDNNSIEGTSRQVIQDKISSLETRNKEVLTSIANKTKGISEEVFNAIVDVNKKQEILRIKATEINADPNIDKKLKDQLISDLESQFNALETKRGVLVSDKVTVLDALSESESTKLKQQAAAELISKAKSEGKTDEQINFTEEEVNKKAIEIYNQSKPNATQQEATTTETKQEAQPQAEAQAEVGEVETNEQKIAKLEAELETITDDNNPRIAEIDAEIEALESEPQRNPINEIPPPPEGFDIVSEKKPAPSQVDNIDKNIEPIVEPINNDNANQNAQQNNEGRNIEKEKIISKKQDNIIVEGDDLILKHGTPHNFDKFQLEKIGTGEGAQAFGYGLYFTDGSKIAESYAKKLSEDKTGIVYTVRIKNGRTSNWADWREPLTQEQEEILYNSLNEEEKKIYQDHLDKAFYPDSPKYDMKYEKEYHGAFDDLKLDKDGFSSYEKQSASGLIYMDLKDAFGQEKATEILKRSGIDGIRYKAKRGYGQETNYVVFNPDSILIESKSNEDIQPTNDNANQNAQQNNEGRNIETKKVTSTKVRNPKTGEFANFDVDIENGNVVEIRNPKTGRIIPEFVEIVNKKTKKVTIKKNANWTSIEADALGLESESKIKEINKNILSNFIPTTAYQAALDFFARGGKVSLESIKYETGNTDSKWATNQSNQEGLSSIESVSENISMKNPNLDQQEIRGELIEVISSFNNVQEVKDEIINTNSENKRIEQEQEARAIIGSLSPQEFAQYESIVAENFMFEEMSEEQIISYFENKYQEQQQYYETETGRQEANEPSGSVEGVSIQESVGETKTKEEQKVRITFGPFNEFADTGVLLSNGDVMLENGEIIKKNNIDSLENIDENQQLKPEQVEPNVDEKAKLDKLADFLKDIDKRLKDFGDETLGINLPVVVARAAIKAMQLAVATAQTAQEVIDAGLDAVKQSDWYKNLSNREQSDIDANLKDYLNKPFQNAPSEKTRLKIEQEIQERLDNNESKKNIIDSISDRREKMIAQDYIERQSNRSVPEVRKKIAESFEKADEALQDKKTTQEKIDKAFRNFITQIADRQFVPKFILNKAGGRLVRNYLIATKGATGYAKEMYDEAYAKIYKGLTSAEIKTLDKIIQLRRFIAIDENRAKNNMPDVVHPDFINANDVKIELAELEKELGTEKFKDLTKRADAYFDEFRGLLTEMQKSGLISKESLDMFFEIDYQPRMFLEFLQNNETDFVPETSSSSSLSSEQIRKLEEGLNTSLIYDSQYLLSRSMNIRAKSIAMNNTNKKLVEFIEKQAKVVEDLKNKTDKTQKEKDTIKYFEELSKRVKINPIVGFTDTGNPKYKYALPKNFKNAYYYIDGVKHNVMMEEVFHEQYFDAAKGFLNGNTKEVVSMVSGTALVKAVATGNNPTFFITNTPRDFFFIATFSEEYGMSVLVNMAKLAKDAFNGVKDIKQGSDNYKNFIKYGGMMDFLKDQGKLKHTEIQKLFDKVDNKKREGFSKVFNAVTLSKLQIYSEVGFRMAVFNRSVKNQLKELGYSKIEDVKDQSVIDDVYTNAVASARGIMDFNQGGKITKDTDAFIPYLNAATQGTRVMVDNFRERPFETTFRTTQTAVLFSGAAIGTSIAMFSAFGDDDDEMTSTERYLYAKKGVSKYDQTNYFIVFTGQKTESGQYSYIRIAKPQQITPFFSMTDGMITSFIKAKIGDESPTDAIDNVKFAFSKNISPLEFSVTGNIARNPLLKSALSYSTGYDFYREEDLSYLRGKVPVPAEGFESKTVEDFYKKIGEETEMSPVRFKAAVESYITTPSTSPYIGFLYGGIDAMASDKEGKEVLNKLGKDLLKSTVNRLKKETTDFNRRLENNNALQKKMEQVEIENLKTKSLFKKYADAYTNKEMTISEISKELEEVAKENPFEAKRLKKMIKDKIKNKDISPYVFEIKYAKSAESKALMLIDLFGDDLKDISKLEPEEKKLLFQMKKIGAINKEVLFEYKRLVEESKKPTN